MIGASNKWTEKENEVLLPIKQYRYLVKNYIACQDLYESLYPSITSTIKDDVVMSGGGNLAEDKMMNILDHRAHCLADLHKQREVIAHIENSINFLPVNERIVIRKFYMNEQKMNMEQVAEEIGVCVETCWKWRRKGVDRLVKKYSKIQ